MQPGGLPSIAAVFTAFVIVAVTPVARAQSGEGATFGRRRGVQLRPARATSSRIRTRRDAVRTRRSCRAERRATRRRDPQQDARATASARPPSRCERGRATRTTPRRASWPSGSSRRRDRGSRRFVIRCNVPCASDQQAVRRGRHRARRREHVAPGAHDVAMTWGGATALTRRVTAAAGWPTELTFKQPANLGAAQSTGGGAQEAGATGAGDASQTGAPTDQPRSRGLSPWFVAGGFVVTSVFSMAPLGRGARHARRPRHLECDADRAADARGRRTRNAHRERAHRDDSDRRARPRSPSAIFATDWRGAPRPRVAARECSQPGALTAVAFRCGCRGDF